MLFRSESLVPVVDTTNLFRTIHGLTVPCTCQLLFWIFKDLRTLSLLQWKTILEGMPDTVLRAKGIVPTTEGPHELQYGTHYCSLTPTESTDYSLVVIGTDFNVPMVHNEVCQS